MNVGVQDPQNGRFSFFDSPTQCVPEDSQMFMFFNNIKITTEFTFRVSPSLETCAGDLSFVLTRDKSFPIGAGTSHHRRLYVKVDRGILSRLAVPILSSWSKKG